MAEPTTTPADRLFTALREFLAVDEKTRRALMSVDPALFDQVHAALSLPDTEGVASLRASGTPVGYVPFNGDSDHLYSRFEDVQTFIEEMAEPSDDWRIYEARLASRTPDQTGQVAP